MVNIAIAGATGDVAKEITDALIAAGRHNLLLLSRRDTSTADEPRPGVHWAKTAYDDANALAALFKHHDIATVLSFVDAMADSPGDFAQSTQKRLIDACVAAGVGRFAPSEWATSDIETLPWYQPKVAPREYLAAINSERKVLEYTLFCPGIFANYYTYPHPSAKHLNIFELNIDFHHRRALLLEGGDDDRVTLTTVQDVAQVVARAVEYEGEWPVMGGINGCELSVGELVAIGEKIRGEFAIERLAAEDLKQHPPVIKSSWLPTVGHHSAPKEVWQAFVPVLIGGMLLANTKGAMRVSDEWNRLLPEYQFTSVEEFLTAAWHGKE